MKTIIGKIRHGFNFLAYYFNHNKILPSKETIRRFHARADVHYVHRDHPKKAQKALRRIDFEASDYAVNEKAPTNAMFAAARMLLLARASHSSDGEARIRRYGENWALWVKTGLSSCDVFIRSVEKYLPSLFDLWNVQKVKILPN